MRRQTIAVIVSVHVALMRVNALPQTTDTLYRRFEAAATDYEQARLFLKGLESNELLVLCNEHAKAVKDNPVSGEAFYPLAIRCLEILKDRQELDVSMLLKVMSDRSLEPLWRGAAGACASGDVEDLVVLTLVDIPGLYDAYMAVLCNEEEVEGLRAGACGALADTLAQGYRLLDQEPRSGEGGDEACAAESALKEHDQRVERFVRTICDLALRKETPVQLRKEQIPSAVARLLRRRGLSMPALDVVEATVQQLTRTTETLPLHYAHLARELILASTLQGVPRVYDAYMAVLSNPEEPEGVRAQACMTLAEALVSAYELLTREPKSGQADDEHWAVRSTIQEHDQRVEQFVRTVCNLALEKTTPASLREDKIPNALRYLLMRRGLLMPAAALDVVDATLRQLAGSAEEPPGEYRWVALELKGVQEQRKPK